MVQLASSMPGPAASSQFQFTVTLLLFQPLALAGGVFVGTATGGSASRVKLQLRRSWFIKAPPVAAVKPTKAAEPTMERILTFCDNSGATGLLVSWARQR